MKAIFPLAAALLLFASCASSNPDLPSGDEQQLNQPGTLSGPPPVDPFSRADDTTLPPVPGQ